MNKMKNIVTVYFGDDWYKEIPIESHQTRKSFEDWHVRGMNDGVAFFRANIEWYDIKKNVFTKSWAFRDGKWLKIKKPVKPDLIYDKIAGGRDYELFETKMEISKKVKIFNNPLMRTSLDNKVSQALLFNEYMPASFVAADRDELFEVTKKINSKKIVIKPIYGSGGFGIIIDEKSVALKKKISYPVLVQEFIKSEKGIPGFSQEKEVADLRLVYFNHKLHYALSRIAKKGSLFTNFHQGATARIVPVRYIPKSVNEISAKIVKKLSIFPKAQYSLDFIFSNDGKPYLVEMNSTPGFDLLMLVGSEKTKKSNFDQFADLVR